MSKREVNLIRYIEILGALLKNHIERLIALALPSLPAAPFLIPLELKILGIGYIGLAYLRFLYVAILLSGAYVWERITKPTRAWLLGTSEHRFRKWIADGLATFAYKILIFWVCVVLLGIFGQPVAIKKIVILSLIYLVENLFIGGLSGNILDWFRRQFIANSTSRDS